MTYREKVAWLTLVSFVVTYTPYFALATWTASPPGMPNLTMLSHLGATAVAQMLLLCVGNIVIRMRTPKGDRDLTDERDHAIERQSTRVAYYVLICGMIMVGVVMPFSESGWPIVNAALFAIFLAEVCHYGIAVWRYRWGWDD